MKKAISLVLAVVICLSLCACGTGDACSCDCPACADCEKKTQNTQIAAADHRNTARNSNEIQLETPVVVAEDQNLRIEAVKFYQEYRRWEKGYPYIADSATEGATLEKFVVFKYYNKTDHTLSVRLDDIYLGSDGANYLSIGGSSVEVAEGKNNLGEFLVQTGEKETLKSMEELYSLDGDFTIWHKGDDGVLRNNYELKFSIPDGMGGSSTDAASLENSRYLGKWQVTDVKIAGENTSDDNDATTEEILKGILDVLDDTYFVFAESGDCCYYTQNGTTIGTWKVTETGVTAGTNVWVAEGDILVCERDGFLLYWEKVSDSQELPET